MERIKVLRKDAGLSQKELAEALGVHQTAVSQWEHGRTMPDIGLLPALAELFKVSVDYLLGRSDDPTDYDGDHGSTSVNPHLLEAHGGNVKKALAAQREIDAEAQENSAYMRTYSFRIRDLRQQRGISEIELAKKAGIHESRLEGIENGAYKISLEELEKVCRALDVSLAEFFAGQQDTGVTTRAAHLADGADDLPPEAEKELAQLMDYLRHKYSKKQ